MNVNKVIIVGKLGRDPEVKYMPNGDAVCNLSVATSQTWKDKNSGEKREKTEWHRITLYRRQAEVAGEYLVKGQEVYIEGRLETRKWQKDGVDQYTTEIIADQMQLGNKAQGTGGNTGGQPQQRAAAPASRPTQAQRPAANLADMDDDIPF